MVDVGFDLYFIFVILGLLLSFVFLELFFRKRGKKELLLPLELALSLSSLIGVLFALLFQNLYDFIQNPSGYKWTWAMTFYGGLIGGTIAFFLIYNLILKKKSGSYLNELLIISGALIPLAHGIGRIGCFVDGCCYGLPTDSWIGVKFVTTESKVIPTNLIEAVFLLLLATVLLLLVFKGHFKYSLPTYMISYGAFRFAIEFFRGDERGSFIPGLSPSQFWSIILFICGICLLLYQLLKSKKSGDSLA